LASELQLRDIGLKLADLLLQLDHGLVCLKLVVQSGDLLGPQLNDIVELSISGTITLKGITEFVADFFGSCLCLCQILFSACKRNEGIFQLAFHTFQRDIIARSSTASLRHRTARKGCCGTYT